MEKPEPTLPTLSHACLSVAIKEVKDVPTWPKLQAIDITDKSVQFVIDQHFSYIKTIGTGRHGVVM